MSLLDRLASRFSSASMQAGVKVHPHQFRHNFAHTWLDRAGWRSAQMLRRYGASAAASRARRSYDRVMGG